MKILYVSTGLGVGGAERVVVDLADQAYERGWQVQIAYLTGPLVVRPRNDEIAITALGMNGYAGLFSGPRNLRRLIARFRPDVVHSHMIHANILARLERLLIRIPRLICSAHNSNEGGRLRMWAYRITNPLGDVFTNVSREAASALEAAGAAPRGFIVPVLNGIDVQKFRPLARQSNSTVTAIAVGRLEVAKDYPNLLHAIRILREAGQRVAVKIVGNGTLAPTLKRLAEELGISDQVEWLGIRRDVPDLLNQSDLFVLPSAWEGFGLVVAEAMACGLPVVATDCGGVREVVGGDRWLVPPRDSAALAGKIAEAMRLTDAEREKTGAANRQRIVDLYSLDTMFQRYEQIYHAGHSREAIT